MLRRERWIKMKILLMLLSTLLLVSCGVSYFLPPSIIHIEINDRQSKSEIKNSVSSFLLDQGFIDYGVAEETLSLLKRSDGLRDEKLIESFEIQNSYLNKKTGISVDFKDCSNTEIKLRQCRNYGRNTDQPISNNPTIELNITESRPGGFSEKGLLFNQNLFGYLSSQYTGVVQILNPPPTDQEKYRSVTLRNTVSGVFIWMISFLMSTLFFAVFFKFVAQKLNLRKNTSRITFVLVNTFLSTPIPMQAATLFVLCLPNALVGWDMDYYAKFGSFVPFSFLGAFLGSIALSYLCFRGWSSSNNELQSTD